MILIVAGWVLGALLVTYLTIGIALAFMLRNDLTLTGRTLVALLWIMYVLSPRKVDDLEKYEI